MMRYVITTILFYEAIAFQTLGSTKVVPKKSAVTLKMTEQIDSIPGQLPPTGYFDPLGLSKGISTAELKKWREAELKHGRVAMLASIGIISTEKFHPLFGGNIEGPAIYHFQEIENIFHPFWYLTLFGIGIVETYTITKGWELNDPNRTGPAMLRDDYVPGDLNFDPSGLKPIGGEKFGKFSDAFIDIRNKELNNGRLAMLGVAGMVAQELVDKRTILGHLVEFGLGPCKPYA
jgi:light-harvesting complex I chlorophyll a/b binding protein 1